MTTDRCSACQRHLGIARLSSQPEIARHNIECAATGERSYPGHTPYASLEQARIDRERALVERIAGMPARGLPVSRT
jgi:hypothetical protein